MSVTTTRRQREKEERRSGIIDAAERVFFRKGFELATMDEVAAEAEVSKGTIYLYFKSKDELFIALSSRVIGLIIERFEALSGQERPGLEQVESMLAAYADIALTHPQHFRTALSWLAAGQQIDTSTPAFARHREQISRVVGALVGAIERGQRDRTIRADVEPIVAAGQLWGGLLGTLIICINRDEMMRRFPQPVDLDTFMPGYIRLICDGLRPRAAAPGEETPS